MSNFIGDAQSQDASANTGNFEAMYIASFINDLSVFTPAGTGLRTNGLSLSDGTNNPKPWALFTAYFAFFSNQPIGAGRAAAIQRNITRGPFPRRSRALVALAPAAFTGMKAMAVIAESKVTNLILSDSAVTRLTPSDSVVTAMQLTDRICL
jgi:hypothetical protein